MKTTILYTLVFLILAGCTTAPVMDKAAPRVPAGSVTVRATPPPLPKVKRLKSTARRTTTVRALTVTPSTSTPVISTVPVECAFHGPVYVTTNHIPHEVRFLAADYQLKAGTTYQFEVSENLVTWIAPVEPYFAPADEVYTRSINFYVNGYYYPRQFMRMRVVSGAPPTSGAFVSVTQLSEGGNAIAADSSGNTLIAGTKDTLPTLTKLASNNAKLWFLQFGGLGSGESKAVGTSADGSVFVAGHFYGTINLGGVPLVSAGSYGIFLAKYSPAGTHVWSKSFGSTRIGASITETATGLAVNPDGSVVFTGIYDGPMDMGGGTLPNITGQEVFLAKFSSTGSHVWSKRIGGNNGLPWSKGVAVDGSGNVMVTGTLSFTVDFGGGPVTAVGSPDMFLAKYSSGGAYQWARTYGVPGFSSGAFVSGSAVAVDSGGNAIVVGEFKAPVSLGGAVLSKAGPDGYTDLFLAKYSSSGTHVWSKSFGDTYPEYGNSVAVDASDNITITGNMNYPVNFGGGLLPCVPFVNAFVANFTPAGSHRWSKSFGLDIGSSKAATVGTGRLSVVGNFRSLTGYGGPALSGSNGTTFLIKYNP